MPPFVIFSLPRSRSAWLSAFLTYEDCVCGHDEVRHMRTFDDIRSWFAQPSVGSVETGAAPFWRTVQSIAPNAKIVVIRRPVNEVVKSLMAVPGVSFDQDLLLKEMKRLDRKLDQIEKRILNVLSINFDDLKREDVCARLFEHCLDRPHNAERWAKLSQNNIQINLSAMMKYFQAYKPQLQKLAEVAKHQACASMALHGRINIDGMSIGTDTFENWQRDAAPLFSNHCVLVGEAPSNWKYKNNKLGKALYDAGALEIITARCNGRMFGYLITLISPSMTSESITTACSTTFYASPDVPGLGMKIQRAALRSLKARGVHEVFFEAGTRGSGPRLDALFRRLGAQEHGKVHRLDLAGVH